MKTLPPLIVGNNRVDVHTADNDFTPVCTAFTPDIAEFIVRACNSHDELVAAIESSLDFALAGIGSFDEVMDKCKKVLIKAKGENNV